MPAEYLGGCTVILSQPWSRETGGGQGRGRRPIHLSKLSISSTLHVCGCREKAVSPWHFQKPAYYLDRTLNHPKCLLIHSFLCISKCWWFLPVPKHLLQEIWFLSVLIGSLLDINVFPSFILYQTRHLVLSHTFSMTVSFLQPSQLKTRLYFAL